MSQVCSTCGCLQPTEHYSFEHCIAAQRAQLAEARARLKGPQCVHGDGPAIVRLKTPQGCAVFQEAREMDLCPQHYLGKDGTIGETELIRDYTADQQFWNARYVEAQAECDRLRAQLRDDVEIGATGLQMLRQWRGATGCSTPEEAGAKIATLQPVGQLTNAAVFGKAAAERHVAAQAQEIKGLREAAAPIAKLAGRLSKRREEEPDPLYGSHGMGPWYPAALLVDAEHIADLSAALSRTPKPEGE